MSAPEPTDGARTCVRCVMDTSDPAIGFDADGVCNHCRRAERLLRALPADDAEADERLAATGRAIAERSPTAEYQCILGLSGGVDSSYVALLAARLGLRVLAVHFDNGWNREVAVSNIQQICDALDFDLVTYVIDWPEFRDLQRAFLRASVIDVELVTDHAIFAAMVRLAREHGIRHVLSGTNFATESILPAAWVWPKQDLRNIRAIHRRFGELPLDSYPTCGTMRWSLLRYSPFGARYVELLNEARYERGRAEEELASEVGWRPYGGKHHESLFTRWYQCGLLPQKFGVDKRRAHLSSLVVSGEIDRAAALAVLSDDPCPPEQVADDEAYVRKKLGFDAPEWERILTAPPRAHDDYPSSALLFRAIGGLRERARLRAAAPAGRG